MPAGRTPKPTKLKQLEGNPGKRKLNKREPKAPSGAPDCPHCLTGEARKEWDRVIPILDEMDLLAKADLGTISTYCQSYGEFVEAQTAVNKQGLTIKINGQVIPNPLISVRRNSQKMMMTAARELGLTAAARSRIHIEQTERPSTNVKAFAQNRDA